MPFSIFSVDCSVARTSSVFLCAKSRNYTAKMTTKLVVFYLSASFWIHCAVGGSYRTVLQSDDHVVGPLDENVHGINDREDVFEAPRSRSASMSLLNTGASSGFLEEENETSSHGSSSGRQERENEDGNVPPVLRRRSFIRPASIAGGLVLGLGTYFAAGSGSHPILVSREARTVGEATSFEHVGQLTSSPEQAFGIDSVMLASALSSPSGVISIGGGLLGGPTSPSPTPSPIFSDQEQVGISAISQRDQSQVIRSGSAQWQREASSATNYGNPAASSQESSVTLDTSLNGKAGGGVLASPGTDTSTTITTPWSTTRTPADSLRTPGLPLNPSQVVPKNNPASAPPAGAGGQSESAPQDTIKNALVPTTLTITTPTTSFTITTPTTSPVAVKTPPPATSRTITTPSTTKLSLTSTSKALDHANLPDEKNKLLHVAKVDESGTQFVVVFGSDAALFDVIESARDILRALDPKKSSSAETTTTLDTKFLSRIAPNYHPPPTGFPDVLKRFSNGNVQWVVIKSLFCDGIFTAGDGALQNYACQFLPDKLRAVLHDLAVTAPEDHLAYTQRSGFVKPVMQMVLKLADHLFHMQNSLKTWSRVKAVNAEWEPVIQGSDQLKLMPFKNWEDASSACGLQHDRDVLGGEMTGLIREVQQLPSGLGSLAIALSQPVKLHVATECGPCPPPHNDVGRGNAESFLQATNIENDPTGCVAFCGHDV